MVFIWLDFNQSDPKKVVKFQLKKHTNLVIFATKWDQRDRSSNI